MKDFIIRLAEKKDDKIINDILSANEMRGSIWISYSRYPSYLDSLKIHGRDNKVIVAEEKSSKNLIAFGTRSIIPAFVNGKIENVGYLSNLRICRDYRGKRVLSAGYEYLGEICRMDKIRFYFSTVVESNITARNILTGNKSYLPFYNDIGKYITFAFSKKALNKKPKLRIARGDKSSIPKIVEFLNENSRKKFLFPYYTEEDFSGKDSFEYFSAEDFFIALENERIIGVLGVWNQKRFRQIIISGFSLPVKFLRPVYNVISGFYRLPNIPKKDSIINFSYISFVSVKDNNPEIFRDLLYAAGRHEDNSEIFFSGLHEKDSLNSAFLKIPCFRFNSRLYLVSWDEKNINYYNKTDIPYVELSRS